MLIIFSSRYRDSQHIRGLFGVDGKRPKTIHGTKLEYALCGWGSELRKRFLLQCFEEYRGVFVKSWGVRYKGQDSCHFGGQASGFSGGGWWR